MSMLTVRIIMPMIHEIQIPPNKLTSQKQSIIIYKQEIYSLFIILEMIPLGENMEFTPQTEIDNDIFVINPQIELQLDSEILSIDGLELLEKFSPQAEEEDELVSPMMEILTSTVSTTIPTPEIISSADNQPSIEDSLEDIDVLVTDPDTQPPSIRSSLPPVFSTFESPQEEFPTIQQIDLDSDIDTLDEIGKNQEIILVSQQIGLQQPMVEPDVADLSILEPVEEFDVEYLTVPRFEEDELQPEVEQREFFPELQQSLDEAIEEQLEQELVIPDAEDPAFFPVLQEVFMDTDVSPLPEPSMEISLDVSFVPPILEPEINVVNVGDVFNSLSADNLQNLFQILLGGTQG
eukprot:TRINITY_DN5523_c1_g1_i1.p2 TRINITY_DN5523_c1_g1~~TRINITY_DN5523_c1_g1_i1.p2  ORF type:complete len:349 (-),score=51.84 TRINITY_DN5523_c1_g1_i1:105-1151(-)